MAKSVKFPFFRVPVWLAYWASVGVIKAVAGLLGFVITPVIYRLRLTPLFILQSRWYWQLIRPWVNPEDWIDERAANKPEYEGLPWWWAQTKGVSFGSWYKYHAIRNPSNGLRSYDFFSVDISRYEAIQYRAYPHVLTNSEPKTVSGLSNKRYFYICWVGFKMGIQFVRVWSNTRYTVIKLGFRVGPEDKEWPKKIPPLGGRGFAGKFLLWRKWNGV